MAKHMEPQPRAALNLDINLTGRAARLVVAAGLAGALWAVPATALAASAVISQAAPDGTTDQTTDPLEEAAGVAEEATDPAEGEVDPTEVVDLAEEDDPAEEETPAGEENISGGEGKVSDNTEDLNESDQDEPAEEEATEIEISGSGNIIVEHATSLASGLGVRKAAFATTQSVQSVTSATVAQVSAPAAATSVAATPTARQGHWEVDARSGVLDRYWVWNDGGIVTAGTLVKPENGAGYYAYVLESSGRVLRGKYDTGRGRVFVADNDGRLLGSDQRTSGWVVTDRYDGGLQRYYVDFNPTSGIVAAQSGFFYAPGYGKASFGIGGEGYVIRTDFEFGGRKWSADNDGRLRDGWYCTDSYGQGLQRYWMGDTAFGVKGAAAVSRLVGPDTRYHDASGYYAYATADGTILRGRWDTGGGRVFVADNDGRLLGSDQRRSGWVVTDHYDGHLERYYVDFSPARGIVAACSGFFYGYGDAPSWGEGGQGYVLRNTNFSFNGVNYWADNDGKLHDLSAKVLKGVDISDWQRGINLSAIAGDFVIVKATQGTTYISPSFLDQANGVLAAGKLLGLYHFVDTSRGATAEADFFVQTISSYIGQAVLVLDWENNDITHQDNLSAGVSYAKTFLDRVYNRTGVKPLIYMSRSVTNEYDWRSVSGAGYELWMAQYLYKYYDGTDGYVDDPTLSYNDAEDGRTEWSSPTIYQYTPNGHLSGYSGSLDLDVFYGSRSAWQRLASRS